MRRLWLIVLVVWGTAVSTTRVLAHAELTSATPAPGSSVKTLSEIELIFSEPVGANSQIELLQEFVIAAELQPVLAPHDATVLRAAVPPLPDGVYTVQWHVTSADGHPISGSYSLGINSTSLQPATPWHQTISILMGVFLLGVAVLFVMVLRHRRLSKTPRNPKEPEKRQQIYN